MRVKILHWNIWFQERADNILKVVKEIDPDIFCCQEVTIGSKFNNKKDVAKIIAKELNYNYNFSSAHKYEFPITPKGESNYGGNAIFSRFPIIKNSNFPIINPLDLPELKYERRTCAVSEIKINEHKKIKVATAHASYNNEFIENREKIGEINRLIHFFKKNNKNLIFTGDLNITHNTKSIKLIEKELKHCGPSYNEPTWTTKPFDFMGFKENKLKWRIDYVFAAKEIKIVSSRIIKTEYSDHLPILLEIEI
ncbi:MAG TPA: endonuclease/exonuclease/phosphatase family protein [Patescibacteria group bacterium]|nr:endonuclease/exonuclease/phosphatase family protein [Patescibacteria group bacterium]